MSLSVTGALFSATPRLMTHPPLSSHPTPTKTLSVSSFSAINLPKSIFPNPRLLPAIRPLSSIGDGTGQGTTAVESTIIDKLDEVKVFDLNGNEVTISDLWKDRKTVVAFARHFGCVLCRKRADYLAAKKEVMDASGVALVVIGPGTVDQARAFSQQTNFKGEVYADPGFSSYDALKFVSGITTTFTPKAGLKIIQLYMEGYRQDWELSFEKDTRERGGWRQGGIIVAGPGKTNISYIHKDQEAGDDPPIEDVLAACCS